MAGFTASDWLSHVVGEKPAVSNSNSFLLDLSKSPEKSFSTSCLDSEVLGAVLWSPIEESLVGGAGVSASNMLTVTYDFFF